MFHMTGTTGARTKTIGLPAIRLEAEISLSTAVVRVHLWV